MEDAEYDIRKLLAGMLSDGVFKSELTLEPDDGGLIVANLDIKRVRLPNGIVVKSRFGSSIDEEDMRQAAAKVAEDS